MDIPNLQILRLQKELQRKEESLSLLKSNLVSKSSDHEVLRRKNTSLAHELATSTNNTSIFMKKATSLSSALRKSKDACSELSERLTTSIPLAEHSTALERLRSDVAQAVKERTEAEERLRELFEALSAEKDERNECRDSLELMRVNVNMLEEKVSTKEMEIETLRIRISALEKDNAQEVGSLKKSHALAVSLLEQSAGNAVLQAEKKLQQAQQQLLSCEKQVTVLLRERCSDQRELELLRSKNRVSQCTSVQAAVSMQTASVQSEFIPRSSASQTDKELEPDSVVDAIMSALTCGSCKGVPCSVLFPCGHLFCEACIGELMEKDLEYKGITCRKCNDELPITRICRWMVPEVLVNVLSTSDWRLQR